jgi:isoamylase
LLSIGVPMIVAGDEFMRSQGGNNNTYCHDNEINWFDWNKIQQSNSQEMIRFWSMLMDKRKSYIDHFKGRYFEGGRNRFGLYDVSWHGTKLNSPGWDDPNALCLGMTLGDTAEDTDQTNNIHVMFNMYWDGIEFEIPQASGLRWYRAIDTALPTPNDIQPRDQQVAIDGSTYLVTGRSIVVLASRETN